MERDRGRYLVRESMNMQDTYLNRERGLYMRIPKNYKTSFGKPLFYIIWIPLFVFILITQIDAGRGAVLGYQLLIILAAYIISHATDYIIYRTGNEARALEEESKRSDEDSAGSE